jgi:hypothetical protein
MGINPILFACILTCALSLIFTILTKETASKYISIYSGIFASSLVVMFLEIANWIRDRMKFAYLEGAYMRTAIRNEEEKRNENDEKYTDIMPEYSDVDPQIELRYRSKGQYNGSLSYKEGFAVFTLYLDPLNPLCGKGSYQYKEKKQGFKMPDIGSYEIQVDCLTKKRIYVRFKNTIPSGLAGGYEIWDKSER